MAKPLPKERDVLIKNYANLTSTVRDIDNLLPYFVSERIINQDDVEEIKAVPRTSDRVARLLKFISGPLDAGFTKGYFKMLDILYYRGNDTTKQLAIAMGRKDDESAVSTTSPQPQPQRGWRQQQSSSVSSCDSVSSPTGDPLIPPEVQFDDNSGHGIIDEYVMNEKKRAVCRIHGSRMTGTGFIGYLGMDGVYFAVLITNHHVIPTMDEAMGCRIRFENAFGVGQSCTIRLCDVIVAGPNNFWTSTPTELDFTIIKLDEARLKDLDTGKSLDINPINVTNPATIKNNDLIHVIQYPFGMNLSHSASPCYVVGPLLLYRSGTIGGSSGSPVLKEVNGQLVPAALHRGGNQNTPQYTGCNYGTLISEILNCISGRSYQSLPSRAEVQLVLDAH